MTVPPKEVFAYEYSSGIDFDAKRLSIKSMFSGPFNGSKSREISCASLFVHTRAE